jgi:hypothetical protein
MARVLFRRFYSVVPTVALALIVCTIAWAGIRTMTLSRYLSATKLQGQTDQCEAKRLQMPLQSPIGLISYPGSGNTWARHIIEQITGVTTASIYCDLSLVDRFPAECDAPQWWTRSIVVKTHTFDCTWKEAIVLLRHPLPTMLAYYNYLEIARRGPGKDWDAHVGTIAASNWDWTAWYKHATATCIEWNAHTAAVLGEPSKPSSGCGNATKTSVFFYEDIRDRLQVHVSASFTDFLRRALNLTQVKTRCIRRDPTGKFKRRTPSDHPAKRVYEDNQTLLILSEYGCWHRYYAYRRHYGRRL